MRRPWSFRISAGVSTAAAFLLLTASCSDSTTSPKGGDITKINHVVVIYLENHSFDNMFGEFPGADGLANATATAKTQVSATGSSYGSLPRGERVADSDDGRQRPVQHRPVRSADRGDARSRASVLSGAEADRRRQDGQVRAGERRVGLEHGLLPHGHPAAARSRPRSTRSPIGSSMRVRRLVPQSPVLDRRRGADVSGRAVEHHRDRSTRAARCSPTAQVTPDGFAVNTSFPVNAAASRDRGGQYARSEPDESRRSAIDSPTRA